MAVVDNIRQSSTSLAVLVLLAACGQGGDAGGTLQEAGVQCVPVPDGYYLFENGQFARVDKPEAELVIVDAPVGWSDRLEDSFADMGYPWLGLNVKSNIATLIGLAPTGDSKEAAFEAGRAAILEDETGGRQITLVVNGISVEGGEAGVGAALASLDERPSLAACQQAFVDTMQGRNVQFRTGSAVILPASAQLLDAVTGVASLCKDYDVEIGGHTDSRGSDTYNQELSERRAQSVRTYLIERNVPGDGLTAVGYGESRPLDDSNTPDAYSKNRRTEFIVSERQG